MDVNGTLVFQAGLLLLNLILVVASQNMHHKGCKVAFDLVCQIPEVSVLCDYLVFKGRYDPVSMKNSFSNHFKWLPSVMFLHR